MILPCEVTVKAVVPAVKALMAQELVRRYGMRQEKVAEILGISQSAVSKYSSGVRGYIIEIGEVEDVPPLISKMITMLMKEECQRAEFLGLFCKVCALVRKTGLMCQFCEKSDSRINASECGFCK